PTLLTLHGSGSSSLIHTIQLARLTRLLKPYFTLTSLNAPFATPAGPGVLPFFEGCGPYASWLPPTHATISASQMRTGTSANVLAPEVEKLVRDAVDEVRGKGGKVVGLVGFSQGSRVLAGLLKAKEIKDTLRDSFSYLRDIDFALVVCGSFPPPLLPSSLIPYLDTPSSLSSANAATPGTGVPPTSPIYETKIQTPTLHVQGKLDEWEWAGQMMITRCYDAERSEVLKLDIGHHYPVKPEDSQKVVAWVLRVWEG
ncbi:hypothetical protein DM02DRAFT_493913, partial [Periconia macrospinosa]